ncbi:MAG: nuclear transport factor 2 family protein [Candidatus Limnocylindrales bacterium]
MSSFASEDPHDLAARWIGAINAHDLEGVVECFDPDYLDHAPARRGESVRGQGEIRANFRKFFDDIKNVRAELRAVVGGADEIWIEWRMFGNRPDGTPMEFTGVNIFGLRDGSFATGRIYTELVRDAGGIEGQIDRMTNWSGAGG